MTKIYLDKSQHWLLLVQYMYTFYFRPFATGKLQRGMFENKGLNEIYCIYTCSLCASLNKFLWL
jgi:hypothetical protein